MEVSRVSRSPPLPPKPSLLLPPLLLLPPSLLLPPLLLLLPLLLFAAPRMLLIVIGGSGGE